MNAQGAGLVGRIGTVAGYRLVAADLETKGWIAQRRGNVTMHCVCRALARIAADAATARRTVAASLAGVGLVASLVTGNPVAATPQPNPCQTIAADLERVPADEAATYLHGMGCVKVGNGNGWKVGVNPCQRAAFRAYDAGLSLEQIDASLTYRHGCTLTVYGWQTRGWFHSL